MIAMFSLNVFHRVFEWKIGYAHEEDVVESEHEHEVVEMRAQVGFLPNPAVTLEEEDDDE